MWACTKRWVSLPHPRMTFNFEPAHVIPADGRPPCSGRAICSFHSLPRRSLTQSPPQHTHRLEILAHAYTSLAPAHPWVQFPPTHTHTHTHRYTQTHTETHSHAHMRIPRRALSTVPAFPTLDPGPTTPSSFQGTRAHLSQYMSPSLCLSLISSWRELAPECGGGEAGLQPSVPWSPTRPAPSAGPTGLKRSPALASRPNATPPACLAVAQRCRSLSHTYPPRKLPFTVFFTNYLPHHANIQIYPSCILLRARLIPLLTSLPLFLSK
jgi:hypothetical protein